MRRLGSKRDITSVALLDVVSDHSVMRFLLLDVFDARITRLPAVWAMPDILRMLELLFRRLIVSRADGDLAEDAFEPDLVEHRHRVSEHAHTRDVDGCFSDQVLLDAVFHLLEMVLVHLTPDRTERLMLHGSKEVCHGVALI